MDLLSITRSKASVVVGLDFGTTFSGFAFARTIDPNNVFKFYEWPHVAEADAGQYCKTQTSLLYEAGDGPQSYVLQDWGYSALVKFSQKSNPQDGAQVTNGKFKSAIEVSRPRHTHQVPCTAPPNSTRSHFITLFKLHLATSSATTPAAALPPGLSVRRVVSDYLRKIAELVMTVLRSKFGTHISMEDVQWCLTVPAIWDESGKQEMVTCAEMAGMIQGPDCRDDDASPHPVQIVIEPEAASLYCQRNVNISFNTGDKFLIVDVGGGTVDLVLHEKVGRGTSLKVREVSPSSGGLCGGSYVDQALIQFLSERISCFRDFSSKHAESLLKMKGVWDTIKFEFDESKAYDLPLPTQLAKQWEQEDRSNHGPAKPDEFYDSIELSITDMKNIFDPVVNQIISLIEEKMIPGLKAMMIVGGFSGSPYLEKRIREKFSHRVVTIVVPKEPGSAVCCGAVLYGIYGPDIIMSRISRKTYGIAYRRPFLRNDPPSLMCFDDDGNPCCTDVFAVFTRKGDEVPLDHCVTQMFCPSRDDQKEARIRLFSSTLRNPRYVCDPEVVQEGNFVVTSPSRNELGETPMILVSMYFGRTSVEVKAEGENFGEGRKFTMPSVRFERSLE